MAKDGISKSAKSSAKSAKVVAVNSDDIAKDIANDISKDIANDISKDIANTDITNIAGTDIANIVAGTDKSPFAVELNIKSCVDKRLVSSFTDFVSQAAQLIGLKISRGPAPLKPTLDQWTVLSSPFVHKTARTQFERRNFGSAMKIDGIWREEVAAKFIWYLKQHVPNEVELDIKFTERHTI